MYIDKSTEQGKILNKIYELTEDIKPLCCKHIIKKGTIIKVELYTSKNRLLVQVKGKNGVTFHKIKRSNLNRVGVEVNDERFKNIF